MNSLKRIFVSIKSQVDQVADEFENHEALAGAAIQDIQAIGSKTRLHLHKLVSCRRNIKNNLRGNKNKLDYGLIVPLKLRIKMNKKHCNV